jgi:hypothetical protein
MVDSNVSQTVEKRRAVASIRFPNWSPEWQNVFTTAVLVNGKTVATFLTDEDADAFIKDWLIRNPQSRHDA